MKFATDAAEHRAWKHWFEDGLPTLVGGAGCLIFGFSLLLSETFSMILAALYGVILLGHRPILEWLKTRLTYPRTGYVTPPYPPPVTELAALSLEADPVRLAETAREQHDRKVRAILTLAMVMAATFGMTYIDSPWIYAAAGVDVAMALWLVNGKDLRLSWIVLGGIPFIGFYMTVLGYTAGFPAHGETRVHRLGYFVAAGGVLIVVDGTVALVRHLRRNPVASVLAE